MEEVLKPEGPRHDAAFKAWVVRAYQDRLSIRGTTRTFGVYYKIIRRWVGEKIRHLPSFEDTLLPGQNGDVLALDKLWNFVQTKAPQVWPWRALGRRTCQIVAYTIGDRSQEGAASLRERVPDDYRRRSTRNDFWLAYGEAFPKRTHRFCGKAEGETNHV